MTQQPSGTRTMDGELRIEIMDLPEDVEAGFACAANAYGKQARDFIWTCMKPGISYDSDRNANTVFIKATLPREGQRVIVGMAIWFQLSMVEGRGIRPSDDIRSSFDLEKLYPNNETEQRYLSQLFRSIVKRRIEVAREKETSQPPSMFHLGLCAVDPAYQRRGIASKLVQWGLDEAKRRGGLEATTEASSMGRHVYERLGFRGEGSDIEYQVDSEFISRERPPNLFMRTGISQ
ncbi:hypothetical protein F5Y06DRAFT_279853 [Hypoxylon sp. FL0890]|nr:hypothetical protein F5Y06DRAFT_279853 [Hypoxylon sp. FL0890]